MITDVPIAPSSELMDDWAAATVEVGIAIVEKELSSEAAEHMLLRRYAALEPQISALDGEMAQVYSLDNFSEQVASVVADQSTEHIKLSAA